MNKKTLLVTTGLSGMIGNRFEELYGHKFEFENLDLTTGIDITNEKSVDNSIKNTEGEIILHLAAFTDVNAAASQKDDKNGPCYQVNVVGTQNIAKAAAKYDKYLIHISTDFVFDGSKKKPYTEEDQTNAIEWYGQTKAEAEIIVKENLKHYSIVRTSFPFRSKFDAKPDVVRKIIQGLKDDNLSPMFSDNFITPTFVDDLCKVFFMFTLKRPRGIYHATGSTSLSTYELAQHIKKTFNLPGKIIESSLEEYLKTASRVYPKSLKMSNRKLQEELGNPMLPVESALQIMKTQL